MSAGLLGACAGVHARTTAAPEGYTLDSVKPDFTVTYGASKAPPGVSDDPQTYATELDKTVEAIVDRFPSTN